jgi:N-acetylmuramoyl-L-alanine amidase
MFSDEETLREALAKLESEKARRNKHKDAPFFDCEVPDLGIVRVLTGVPRSEAEGVWYAKNCPEPRAPAMPQVSGAEDLVPLQHGIAAAQIFEKVDSLPSEPPLSGRVRIEVDPGNGADDCGVVAEADWAVHGDELVLKIGNEPATLHPLMGGYPVAVAKRALREKVKESAFHRRLQYPTIGIV